MFLPANYGIRYSLSMNRLLFFRFRESNQHTAVRPEIVSC